LEAAVDSLLYFFGSILCTVRAYSGPTFPSIAKVAAKIIFMYEYAGIFEQNSAMAATPEANTKAPHRHTNSGIKDGPGAATRCQQICSRNQIGSRSLQIFLASSIDAHSRTGNKEIAPNLQR
jgi:hypothetical protein